MNTQIWGLRDDLPQMMADALDKRRDSST